MTLRPIELSNSVVFAQNLPKPIENWIQAARGRLQQFWDRFRDHPVDQYIECDFEVVASGIAHCVESELIDGRLFVEWGSGFGVVTGIASLHGLEAVGIEAEEFLCNQARELLASNQIAAEIWQGNFLPPGAQDLAESDDPLVSLSHDLAPAYAEQGMDVSDFALVFAYPWPGEEHFLRLVFDRSARRGALLLFYRGPYHLELYRKV